MVQRKVPSKLGIQADHVKFEKRLANLKTSSQFQDGKHRGADLKKKMKKSRSIKLSDIESLRSSPLRKNISQPGKPPPPSLNVPNTAAFPQKQPMNKTTYGSPNYMKPTSCSDARKEQSQVSVRNSPTIYSDSKNEHQRNSSSSKLSSASNHKPERTSTRTSSLKLVRTLIKSPSFKPARGSAKKSSRVALCADMNVQRATCSSTLKDTKFPDYLVINPGGTEAEGTSVMKVCPYTYCSLNGHHHSPVPPLKCFLSAKRRSLKTQKMMKRQALSPRGMKQSNDGVKEIDLQRMLFDDNDKNADPMKHEVGLDFFVEIYATRKEDDAEEIGREAGADLVGEQDDSNGEPNDASGEAAEENNANTLVEENLSDRSPHSESDSEAESFEGFAEEDQKEDIDEYYKALLDQEETAMGSSSNESDFEELSSIEVHYASSETTDMEWEEGRLSTGVLDDNESGSNAGFSSIIGEADMHEEPLIKSDAISGNCNHMIEDYHEVLQGLLEEKNQSFEGQLNDGGGSERDDAKQNFEIQESEQGYDRLSYDQLSYGDDAFEEDSDLSETDCIELSSSSAEEPIEELTETGVEIQEQSGVKAEDHDINSCLGDVESNCTSAETDETSDKPETIEGCTGSLDKENSETDQNVATSNAVLSQELTAMVAGNQMEETEQADDSKSSEQIQLSDEDAFKIEDHENCKKTEPFQLNDSAEVGNLSGGKYKKPKISTSIESKDQGDLRLNNRSGLSENSTGESHNMEMENNSEPDATETFMANNSISPGLKRKFSHGESNSKQELPDACNYRRGSKFKRLSVDEEEQRKYNPREPNYLPVVPDPEAEKVDLRHQMMDEKKNAEEWMLDFALQQAVTKLAPARKKKVALLVEAFEAVMPVPKCETSRRHTSAAFSQARPMQACS
ncbi:hypothetical protein PRUPE_2G029500 [Prunus persica]|uniref:Calmodulin-binding domain-containing protein n=1 Tax=Prunus persica TaxID=3760 RepID=M5XIY0_PRUPE|nr:hypothetical protein PRUPE_2G029500 [Prunus persica]ONI20695.1 hypothetical protein PRUPE_2G029500 [Prunus persica]